MNHKLNSGTQELLKWIAIITMTIDHANRILEIDSTILTILGRISFPLFAFLIGYNTIHHCKKPQKMLWSLGIFAIISQPIFQNAFESEYIYNILVTLLIGSFLSFTYFRNKFSLATMIITFILGFVSLFVEYTFFGIALILIFAWYEKKPHVWKIIVISIICVGMNYPFGIISLSALIPIMIILTLRGKKIKLKRMNRLVFYVFYPAHILLLTLIHNLPYFK